LIDADMRQWNDGMAERGERHAPLRSGRSTEIQRIQPSSRQRSSWTGAASRRPAPSRSRSSPRQAAGGDQDARGGPRAVMEARQERRRRLEPVLTLEDGQPPSLDFDEGAPALPFCFRFPAELVEVYPALAGKVRGSLHVACPRQLTFFCAAHQVGMPPSLAHERLPFSGRLVWGARYEFDFDSVGAQRAFRFCACELFLLACNSGGGSCAAAVFRNRVAKSGPWRPFNDLGYRLIPYDQPSRLLDWRDPSERRSEQRIRRWPAYQQADGEPRDAAIGTTSG
jgi:hypothetical protein